MVKTCVHVHTYSLSFFRYIITVYVSSIISAELITLRCLSYCNQNVSYILELFASHKIVLLPGRKNARRKSKYLIDF